MQLVSAVLVQLVLLVKTQPGLSRVFAPLDSLEIDAPISMSVQRAMTTVTPSLVVTTQLVHSSAIVIRVTVAPARPVTSVTTASPKMTIVMTMQPVLLLEVHSCVRVTMDTLAVARNAQTLTSAQLVLIIVSLGFPVFRTLKQCVWTRTGRSCAYVHEDWKEVALCVLIRTSARAELTTATPTPRASTLFRRLNVRVILASLELGPDRQAVRMSTSVDRY